MSITVTAELRLVRTWHAPLRDVDPERLRDLVEWIAARGEAEAWQQLPPPLVAEGFLGRVVPIDGHLRLAAACYLQRHHVEAWTITYTQLDDLLLSNFGGRPLAAFGPAQLGPVRRSILCGDTSGDSICPRGRR